MLDPDPLPVERVVGTGHVAGGEHARRAGLQVLVDEDPIVHGDSGSRGEFGARLHTDSDDHEVALEFAAVAGADALDRLVSLECRDAGPHEHLHPLVGVDVAVDGAYLGAQHALQGDLIRIEEVTSRPRWRAEAATSAPIHPAPTTTTVPPRSSRRAGRRSP